MNIEIGKRYTCAHPDVEYVEIHNEFGGLFEGHVQFRDKPWQIIHFYSWDGSCPNCPSISLVAEVVPALFSEASSVQPVPKEPDRVPVLQVDQYAETWFDKDRPLSSIWSKYDD